MPAYKYLAKNIAGRSIHGKMMAGDEQQLAEMLRDKQLFLLESVELRLAAAALRLKTAQLVDFNRQLGTMLASGVSLIRAIEIMLQRDVSKNEKLVLHGLEEGLLRGRSLSETMESCGGAFPPLMINMYKAGEANGALDKTAQKMAAHYDQEHRLNQRIKSASTYPMVLLCLMLLVMMLIFKFILPRFAALYGDMQLPGITRVVMSISQLFTEHFLLLLIGVLLLVVAVKALCAIPAVRLALDRLKLRLPLFGKLLRKIYTARFARTLSSLYASGLSILSTLEVTRGTIGNKYIESQFAAVIKEISSGNPLSAAVAKIDGYERKLASSIMIGEETGRLDEMLESTAESFDYEAQQATNKLTTILEPLLIVLMAVLVGGLILAVMLPIYQMYSTIGA